MIFDILKLLKSKDVQFIYFTFATVEVSKCFKSKNDNFYDENIIIFMTFKVSKLLRFKEVKLLQLQSIYLKMI